MFDSLYKPIKSICRKIKASSGRLNKILEHDSKECDKHFDNFLYLKLLSQEKKKITNCQVDSEFHPKSAPGFERVQEILHTK